MKRFTQDLLKLLKFQASKRVAVKDFMQAYHWSVDLRSCRQPRPVHCLNCSFVTVACFVRCFSRDWRVTDYGTCDLMDLLAEIPDTTITISHQSSDTVISVPKRGQFNNLSSRNHFCRCCDRDLLCSTYKAGGVGGPGTENLFNVQAELN